MVFGVVFGLPTQVLAWATFELGYWGSASMTSQTLIPLLLKSTLGDLAGNAPILWGWIIAMATLLGVGSCPIIGAFADMTETRKLLVCIFTFVAIGFSFLFLLVRDDWRVAALCAGFCILPTVITMTLFNSLLVFLAQSETELSRASTAATFLGCLGPAFLLTALRFNTLDENMSEGLLWLLFSVAAVWWLSFSVPLYMLVPEFKSDAPERSVETHKEEAMDMLKETFANKNLLKLLVALFIFGDSSAAMFHLSFIFGSSVGIDTQSLFSGLVVNKWMSVIMCFFWSAAVGKMTAKFGFVIVMIAMLGSTVVAYLMTTAAEFWVLQILLSVVSTGTFIFCRVLLASVTPVEKAGLHFGFLGAVGNLSGFFGPVIYSVVGEVTGNPRNGFLLLACLTGLAIFLLSSVDFDLARLAARPDPVTDKEDEDTKRI